MHTLQGFRGACGAGLAAEFPLLQQIMPTLRGGRKQSRRLTAPNAPTRELGPWRGRMCTEGNQRPACLNAVAPLSSLSMCASSSLPLLPFPLSLSLPLSPALSPGGQIVCIRLLFSFSRTRKHIDNRHHTGVYQRHTKRSPARFLPPSSAPGNMRFQRRMVKGRATQKSFTRGKNRLFHREIPCILPHCRRRNPP